MRWKRLIGIGFLMLIVCGIAAYLFKGYLIERLNQQIFQAIKDATGLEVKIQGRIHFAPGMMPTFTVHHVHVYNPSWETHPQLAAIKRIKIQVVLRPLFSGRLQIARIILIKPDILFEINQWGKSNFEFKTSEQSPEKEKQEVPVNIRDKLPAIMMNDFQIKRGRLTYKDARNKINLSLDLEHLEMAVPSFEKPIRLKSRMGLNKNKLEADIILGSLASLINQEAPWPFQATLRAYESILKMKGAVKDILTRPKIYSAFSFGRMNRPGSENIVPQTSDLSGIVEVMMGEGTPVVQADLSSKNFDISPLLKGIKKPEQNEIHVKRIFPDAPFRLDTLKKINAGIRIQAEHVFLQRLSLTKLNMDMDIKDGNLAVNSLKAGLAGGNLDMQFDIKTRDSTASLNAVLKAEHINLKTMLIDIMDLDTIEGVMNADISIEGRGNSISDMMASLNGRSAIAVVNGKIPNKKFIKFLSRESRSDRTIVNWFVSGFNIAQGSADTTAFVLDSDHVLVIGEGGINLKTEELNFRFDPIPKGGIGTKMTGKVNTSLGSLTKAFRLKGTLAEPSWKMDSTGTAITVGKMVGGVMLLGPIGLAVPFVRESRINESLYLTAVESARTGIRMSELMKQKKPDNVVKKAASGTKKVFQSIGQGVKKIFK
ncbi:MAG: AsmA family protein [Candidatus Aureabacteria bacterium]|nr:AsmA family protein [Candidatus Auribacterota bacterium]